MAILTFTTCIYTLLSLSLSTVTSPVSSSSLLPCQNVKENHRFLRPSETADVSSSFVYYERRWSHWKKTPAETKTSTCPVNRHKDTLATGHSVPKHTSSSWSAPPFVVVVVCSRVHGAACFLWCQSIARVCVSLSLSLRSSVTLRTNPTGSSFHPFIASWITH